MQPPTPGAKPLSSSCADLAGRPLPLSHSITTKQLSRLLSFKGCSGQVHVGALNIAQMAARWRTTTRTITFHLSAALSLESTRECFSRCWLHSSKVPKSCLIYFALQTSLVASSYWFRISHTFADSQPPLAMYWTHDPKLPRLAAQVPELVGGFTN